MGNTNSELQLNCLKKFMLLTNSPQNPIMNNYVLQNMCLIINLCRCCFLGLIYTFDFTMSSWPAKPEYLLSSLSPKGFANPCSSLISSHSTNNGIICSHVLTSSKVYKTLKSANLSPKLLDSNTNNLNWRMKVQYNNSL